MAYLEQIQRWIENAPNNSTHLIVVCDTFNYEDYPVYSNNPQKTINEYNLKPMQKVRELYSLKGKTPIADQLKKDRAWCFN